jgi:DNA-binding winged helix-turn-helix (wHTH) protein
MLEQLIRAAGEVVPDDALIHAIWGQTPAPTALYNCAASLTRALEDVRAAIAVKRFRGLGYRLLASPPRPD